MIGEVIDLISNKWSVPIILALAQNKGPVRFSSLARGIPVITQKELTKQLRALEAAGLITRTVFAVVPPRVEYQLTDLGRSLRQALAGLASWAIANQAKITAHRARHERSEQQRMRA